MKNWKTTLTAIVLFALSLSYEQGFITTEIYTLAIGTGASLGFWASKDASNKEKEEQK
jgi:hypothetical protein